MSVHRKTALPKNKDVTGLLISKQVAERLELEVETVRAYSSIGKLKPKARVNHRIYFTEEEVGRFNKERNKPGRKRG